MSQYEYFLKKVMSGVCFGFEILVRHFPVVNVQTHPVVNVEIHFDNA